MTRTIAIDHLPRIEGHAGIMVVLDGSRIERVEADVFEGIRLFEGLLAGRTFLDVPAVVSRICAICSHGHTIVALQALEAALGIEVSQQTRRLRDLAFQGASIESHALHVFCLALPDFLGHPSVLSLAAEHRDAVAMALRLKKLGNSIQEVVGGRAVHPVNYVIGGFGRTPTVDQLLQLRTDLEKGLEDCGQAVEWLRHVPIPSFVEEPVRCAALVPDGDAFFFGRAVRLSDGGVIPVDRYREITNERPVAHSHAKHSTHDGRSFMVGALARLTLNGDRIRGRAREAWSAIGPAVPSRNIVANTLAQAIELVYSVEHALDLVNGFLESGLPAETPPPCEVRASRGVAASEVPRGTLFHAYELDANGRIVAADVITPTAQNFANLEDQLRATVRDAGTASDDVLRERLQIVARAYDPCVSCSVHVIRASRP
jgi:sulfhydrogenase subunit alpha